MADWLITVQYRVRSNEASPELLLNFADAVSLALPFMVNGSEKSDIRAWSEQTSAMLVHGGAVAIKVQRVTPDTRL